MVTHILGSNLTADGKVGNASGVATLAKPAAGQFPGTVDVEVDMSPFEVSNAALTGIYVSDAPAAGRAMGTTNISPGLSTIILRTVNANEVIGMDTEATLHESVVHDLLKK